MLVAAAKYVRRGPTGGTHSGSSDYTAILRDMQSDSMRELAASYYGCRAERRPCGYCKGYSLCLAHSWDFGGPCCCLLCDGFRRTAPAAEGCAGGPIPDRLPLP